MKEGRHGETASTMRWWETAWAAYAACIWALLFAVAHLYWALGGTVGLPSGFTITMNPALFAINVVAVPLCVVGALLALALVRPWGRLFPRLLLLIVHSAPTLLGGGLAVGLRGANLTVLERWSLFVYEPWFFAGGLLYGMAARYYGQPSP